MVEELLDFSKLLSGNMTLQMVRTDVAELVEYIKQHMTPVAQRSKISFSVEYPDQLPQLVLDINRIKQVLINVLDNAFKFTRQGGRVRFAAYEAEGYLIMEVEDNGCGISLRSCHMLRRSSIGGKTANHQAV